MVKLHVISHTHWDREWYLTFQQFRLKLVHLIDKLLDILAEDPDFKYFMLDGQTIVLDDYLQIRPEKEDLLRQYIQEGRILIGPWHILPDMFLVSPEAHIRNLLEGARTASKFGPKMPIGYIPDPFGHPAQVPQILRGFGINTAALWRGLGDLPAELWWESPDGSKVFLAYLRDSYSNGANLIVHNFPLFAQQISVAGASLATHSAVNDYLIMLGTDHMEPSPHTSAAISYANEHLVDTQVIHSTLSAYIQRISEQISNNEIFLPVIKGELRACDHSHLLPGVLSSRMWIKQNNHSCQLLLEKWAEPFCVFSENMIKREKNTWTSQVQPTNRVHQVAPIIRYAWRMLMENHPHDSICGCSIDQVHDEMKPRFDQVEQIGEEITLQALQNISQTVQTKFEDRLSAIVLFNPFCFSHHDLIEVELNIPEHIAAFEIQDANGNTIPHEFLGSNHEMLANLLLTKNNLRDTIGAINEGWIAGSAIVDVKVSRRNNIVTIDAILDDQGQPNIPAWHHAEEQIARYEADPSVMQFHVIAYTPRASKIRFLSPDIPAFGWQTVWVRAVDGINVPSTSDLNPLVKKLLPLGIRFAQSKFGEKMLSKLTTGNERKGPFIIENEFFLVKVNETDGTLIITDKITNTIFNGLNRFVDGGDAGDEYNYSPPLYDSFFSPKVVSLKIFRSELAPSIEIEYELKIPAEISPDRKTRSTKKISIPIRSRVMLCKWCCPCGN